jgi:hypothetical protein
MLEFSLTTFAVGVSVPTLWTCFLLWWFTRKWDVEQRKADQ